MNNKRHHGQVRSRNEPFTERTATRIWFEEATDDNPYIANSIRCHGYDLFELMDQCSFVDVFYLLFRGDLPDKDESKLLQTLMIALINPGPRHPATRAAMNVGVGKTDPVNILPIASAVLGGNYLGGGAIEETIRFFRKNQRTNPAEIVELNLEDLEKDKTQELSENNSLIPGFGYYYGGIDLIAADIADRLISLPGAGKTLTWGREIANNLSPHGMGWLIPGVAAAVFADLGFQPRAGGALFQLLGAPGLVAHGLELANKPTTAMPFVRDEDYVIER